MALRIGDLTVATSFVGTDEFELTLAGSAGSRKVTGSNLRKQLFAGGTGFTATDPLNAGITTLAGGTVTTSNPVLSMTQTWNDGAVTFTGIKLVVTNTASADASMLLDLRTSLGTVFNVTRPGKVTINEIGTRSWNIDPTAISGTLVLTSADSLGTLKINVDSWINQALRVGAPNPGTYTIKTVTSAAPTANHRDIWLTGDRTSAANNDTVSGLHVDAITINNGAAHTGLIYRGVYVANPGGAGTWATTYGIYVESITRGTTSVGIYVAGGGLSVAGGTTAVQALTATTVTATGLATLSGGFSLGGTGAFVGQDATWNEGGVRSWTLGVASSSGNLTLTSGDGNGALRLGVNLSLVSGFLIAGGMATTNATAPTLCISNSTAPSGNPVGGGFLFAEAGAGKWRGSGGTVTTFGPA